MTYAGARTICDADSHLMELPDFLTAHADPAERDRMPPMGSLAVGQFNPHAHVGKAGHDAETVAKLVALGDNLTRGPKWHDALGSFSGPERTVEIRTRSMRPVTPLPYPVTRNKLIDAVAAALEAAPAT